MEGGREGGRKENKCVVQDVKKRKALNTVVENVKWCSCCGKMIWWFLKNLKYNYHMLYHLYF